VFHAQTLEDEAQALKEKLQWASKSADTSSLFGPLA
jgi:hypothetical protein